MVKFGFGGWLRARIRRRIRRQICAGGRKLEVAAKLGLPLGAAIFGFARQAERKICVLSAKFKI